MSWWSSPIANEPVIFWRILVCAILAMGLWEILKPSRPLLKPVAVRWGSHAALFAIGSVLIAVVMPVGLVAVAYAVQKTPYGQFIAAHVPYWVRFILAILLIDLNRYAGHYACHAFGPLWRIHSIHHSDQDFDFSTGFRHHPLEGLVFQGVELAVIAATASPPVAVFISELAAAIQSLLMHANAVCPPKLDRFLRLFFITPSFHLVHHSTEMNEQKSNLGTLFPFWDRIFKTCIEHPRLGNEMEIGLDGVEPARALNIWYLLAMPFGKMPGTADQPASPALLVEPGSERVLD